MKFNILSMLSQRMKYLDYLGKQYDGDRDLYKALGYKKTLTYQDYFARYSRQDIAAAVVEKYPQYTWLGGFAVKDKDNVESPLNDKWHELDLKFHFAKLFKRLDILTRIGHYGVLFMGFSDCKKHEDFKNPVTPGVDLVYLKPLSEDSCTITEFDYSPSSSRFGLPLFYEVTLTNDKGNSSTFQVHYSRIIHVAENTLESELIGEPALKGVYNRLEDLEKIVGGSGEMFWRGARPGYQGKVNPDFQMTTEVEEQLKAQLDEYENNLRRFLINEGIDLEALKTQIENPEMHVEVQLKMISAKTGIPTRILVGSEVGKLASTQDKDTWLTLVRQRRENYAEVSIIRPFVDKCLELGILPEVQAYDIVWEDLFAPSTKEKAEVGAIRSQSLKFYTQNPVAPMIIPPNVFIKYFLGLSDQETERVQLEHTLDLTDEKGLEQFIREMSKGFGGEPDSTLGHDQTEFRSDSPVQEASANV